MGWVVMMCIIFIFIMSWWWLLLSMMMKKKKNDDENKGKIPKGNSGWPFVGETLDFIASGYSSRPVTFFQKRTSLYGKVFRTSILGSNLVVSTDPEVNKVILHNQGNIFVPAYPKSVRELVGEHSILNMNGNLHRKLHSLITTFLRSPQLKSRITRDIQCSVQHCLASWTKHQTVYVQDQVKEITFTILVKVLMSIAPGEELNFLKKEFEEFIKGLICLPLKFPGTTLYKSLKAKERMVKIVRRIVEERSKKAEKDKDDINNDMVDVLLRDHKSDSNVTLTLETISQHIIELMVPGEESLPTAMTVALNFLTHSPPALSKLREENIELQRQKNNCLVNYTWNDYMSLPFTQNVISETLRMANLVNGIWRKAVKDVEIKGYLIPKDWVVMACLTSVHLDDENYENPYNFDPLRWEKNGAVVSNNCFTPFGGGQRLCPGLELSRLELSIFLHHLVTTYSWVAEKDEVVYFPTVKMKRKFPIILQHINA